MATAFVLVDIFEGIDRFFKHLDALTEVKEKHQNSVVYSEPPTAKINDYEVILKIEAKEPDRIRHVLQEIKTYRGVEDIRVLTVV